MKRTAIIFFFFILGLTGIAAQTIIVEYIDGRVDFLTEKGWQSLDFASSLENLAQVRLDRQSTVILKKGNLSVTLRSPGTYSMSDTFNPRNSQQAESNQNLVKLIGNKLRKLSQGGLKQESTNMGVRGNRYSSSLSFIDEDSPMAMLLSLGPALDEGKTDLAWSIVESALASSLGSEKPDIALAAMRVYIEHNLARLALPLIEQSQAASHSSVYAEFCLAACQISLDAMDYEKVIYWSQQSSSLKLEVEQAQMFSLLEGIALLGSGRASDAKQKLQTAIVAEGDAELSAEALRQLELLTQA